MLKAGRSTLCALRQFGSCVSEVKRPRPAGPEASALKPAPTFLSKRDSSQSGSTSSKLETMIREPSPGTSSSIDGAVFAREFREPFDGMGGVKVEEVADQHVAGRARDRLKMRRVFHGVSPPCAFLLHAAAPRRSFIN